MSPTAEPRRGAIIFIFVTVLLDMLAIGVIIPVFPKLVVDFTGGDTARGAEFLGLFGTVWALMQLVFSPILGALSDQFGRRRIILISNFGLSADYVLIALSRSWPWLLVGRIISGITASSISTSYAYIADVTPPEKRAAGFGMLGAAFGVGFIAGPAIGGWLGQSNPRLPFWMSAALSLANAMYGLFVLPESLPMDRRMRFAWKRANPVGSLALLWKHPGVFGLGCVNFLAYLAHVALPSTFVLYTSYRYGWTERTTGFALAGVGVGQMIVQAGLIKPAIARLGERTTLLIGLACGVAGFAVAGLAPTGAMFSWCIPLTALWGLSGPPVMSLMSAKVGGSEQGQLQGANNSLRAVTEIIGPSVFTLSFAYFIGAGRRWEVPGAPFLIGAVLLLASAALAWKVAIGGVPASEPPGTTAPVVENALEP
jgi:MFS transporter, DHA1 family, tetracycline resistance protein